MTKDCRFNNFSVRFFSHNQDNEELKFIDYDFSVFEEGYFDRNLLFNRCRNQIIFDSNSHILELSNCDKFIIVKKGVQFDVLWTSLSGNNELYDMRGGKTRLFDYLFLMLQAKNKRALYFGNSIEAALAGWRNECNLDILYQENFIDEFLKKSSETFLPF